MLFRRIRTHVRAHDWFAVVVDIIVVVIGIYLGFQVTAWDEERRLLDQREDYLQRLVSDLQDDLSEADIVDRINRVSVKGISLIEDGLLDAYRFVSSKDVDFVQLRILSGTRHIILRRNTFDEMQSSGKLGVLVGNKLLENDLVEYYSNREVRDQFSVMMSMIEQEFSLALAGTLSSDQELAYWPEEFKQQVDFEFPKVANSALEKQAYIDAIKARPEIQRLLPRLKSAKVSRMREANIVRVEAKKLIQRIEEELKQDG